MAQNLKGGHKGTLVRPPIYLVVGLVRLIVLNIRIIIFMLGHNSGSCGFIKMCIPVRI